MIIFDKTELGRAEIPARGEDIGARLRTLLRYYWWTAR